MDDIRHQFELHKSWGGLRSGFGPRCDTQYPEQDLRNDLGFHYCFCPSGWLKPLGHGKPPLIGPTTNGIGLFRRKTRLLVFTLDNQRHSMDPRKGPPSKTAEATM